MKRFLLILIALLVLVSTFTPPATVIGGTITTQSGQVNLFALNDLLVKGLRATREDEKLYIAEVVRLVGEKKLPVSLVYASFQYARKRRPDYPFPYFRYSVKTLAKRKNIDL
jgi:hypothetical protein